MKHRPEITAVILTATGRGFCAGVDIKEMQSMPGHEGILESTGRAPRLSGRLRMRRPGRVCRQRLLSGTGIGLAGSADIVLAAEGVKFGLPEVDNGALGAATHLGRLVPEKHLRWMLYSCEPVSAEQLREWGTVLDVVPAGELMDRAGDRRVIASKAAPVIRAAKASLLGIDHAPMNSYRFEQGFTYELNLQGHGDEARDALLRGERDANSAAD